MLPHMPQWLAHHPTMVLRQRILEDGKFAHLDNDEDRIKFMANALIKYGLELEGYPNDEKSSAASVNFRFEGNRAFASSPATSTDLESVLVLYSKSVVCALPGSRELSLAYANRSAVLFKAHRYDDCLLDIDRALHTGYPDDLKPKLLIRKAKCIYALTGDINPEIDKTLTEARSLVLKLPSDDKYRQAIEDVVNNLDNISSIGKFVKKNALPNYVPHLEKENPTLPGASDAIKLSFSKNHGTHVVATRNIKSGEVLMLQKPYVTIIDSQSWYNLCAYCGIQNWNGIPCDHCVSVLYCSDPCKQAAWSEYHDIECQIHGRMKVLNHHSGMGLRLTIKALKEAGSLERLKVLLSELDSLREQTAEARFDPTSYSTIYVMLDNTDNKPPEELIHWSSNAVEITYFLATRTEILGKKLARDLRIVKDAKWFTFTAALISKNMKIAKTRANMIFVKGGDGVTVHKTITLVPVYSFLNHSCFSSTGPLPFPDGVALITPVPIKEGEEVFTCYGPHFMKMKKELRAEILKVEYHFVCDCPACKYDWTPSTCTTYEKQDLPLEVLNKLAELKKTNKDSAHMENTRKKICAALDILYPHIRHPCSGVQQLTELVEDMFYSMCRPQPLLEQ